MTKSYSVNCAGFSSAPVAIALAALIVSIFFGAPHAPAQDSDLQRRGQGPGFAWKAAQGDIPEAKDALVFDFPAPLGSQVLVVVAGDRQDFRGRPVWMLLRAGVEPVMATVDEKYSGLLAAPSSDDENPWEDVAAALADAALPYELRSVLSQSPRGSGRIKLALSKLYPDGDPASATRHFPAGGHTSVLVVSDMNGVPMFSCPDGMLVVD